jgi:hypothetical protein
MDSALKTTLWRQFGAAIDMLENAVRDCPENVWSGNSPRIEQQFWYLASHTLFWLDFYLADSSEGFAPQPPFGMQEMDPAGAYPSRVYTKDEVRAYLDHCRAKCRAAISNLTLARMQERWKLERMDFSIMELHLYNMRHVQHHAAQLNMILRQQIDSAPRWVGKTKLALSD